MARRVWRLVTLLALGLTAIPAGIAFVVTPDGSTLGIPVAWLAGSPFRDFRMPGAALAAMGILSLTAAGAVWRRHPAAWALTGATAGGFVVWIAVQAAFMGSFRHPMQTVLQAVVLGAAVALGVSALGDLQAWRRSRGARSP